AVEEGGDGDDEPGRAEAALDGARVDARLVDRMQRVPAREPLDRDDLVPLRLRREHEARADERSVEEHGARAALALLAGVLRARQLECVAEEREEALTAPGVRLETLAVDRQRDPHERRHLSSVREARTRRAWRRESAVARTSSIGAAAYATLSGSSAAPASGAVTRLAVTAAEPKAALTSPSVVSTTTASE